MEDFGLRAFLLALSLLPGVFIGVLLKMSLYIFHSVILGWGDSSPRWYFDIQGTVRLALMAVSVIACMFLSQHLYKKRAARKEEGR